MRAVNVDTMMDAVDAKRREQADEEIRRVARYALLDREAQDRLPLVTYTVDNLLVEDTLAVMYGTWGTYKTFTALDLACSIVTRTACLGQTVRRSGPVLDVCAESPNGWAMRRRAWEAYHDQEARVLLLPRALPMLLPEEVAGFIESVKRRLDASEPPVAITLDTTSRCMAGFNENTQEHMSAFIESAAQFRHIWPGVVVLALHHENAPGGLRGSTVLPDGIETLIHAVRPRDGALVTLTVEKTKDFEEGFHLSARLTPVAEPTIDVVGNEITVTRSCVLVPDLTAVPATGTPAAQKIPPSYRTALRWIVTCGRPVMSGEWWKATELPERTFYNARKALVAWTCVHHDKGTGLYTVTDYGRTRLREWFGK